VYLSGSDKASERDSAPHSSSHHADPTVYREASLPGLFQRIQLRRASGPQCLLIMGMPQFQSTAECPVPQVLVQSLPPALPSHTLSALALLYMLCTRSNGDCSLGVHVQCTPDAAKLSAVFLDAPWQPRPDADTFPAPGVTLQVLA
ncbi:hypothetical protein KIPB_016562, partial [Kipferlia bialata]